MFALRGARVGVAWVLPYSWPVKAWCSSDFFNAFFAEDVVYVFECLFEHMIVVKSRKSWEGQHLTRKSWLNVCILAA
jgi:hypothetical protein